MRKLCLLTMAFLLCASCRNAPVDENQAPSQTAPLEAPDNSGRKLAGKFILEAAEDDYGISDVSAETILIFDESGNFERERSSKGNLLSVEEGGYVISARGEIVLYVEKIGGELLEAARVERYTIKEESDSRLKLQAGPSRSFILQRK